MKKNVVLSSLGEKCIVLNIRSIFIFKIFFLKKKETFKSVTIIIGTDLVPHLQLYGIDESATFVTLVPTGLWVCAVGTDSFYEAVGKEALAVVAAQLLHCVFQQKPILVQAPENILGYPTANYRVQRQLTD